MVEVTIRKISGIRPVLIWLDDKFSINSIKGEYNEGDTVSVSLKPFPGLRVTRDRKVKEGEKEVVGRFGLPVEIELINLTSL